MKATVSYEFFLQLELVSLGIVSRKVENRNNC